MSTKKAKTFNSQVYSITCKRLKLKRREKIIFYRLLGFLIRNDKPFPYSANSLSDLTGYSRSSVFESFNLLEKLRLIDRIGFTNRVKYTKGSILTRICTLVQNRINKELVNKYTLVQKLDESAPTSPETGYKKTSSSLKRKEVNIISSKNKERRILYNTEYHEYVRRIETDKELGLIKNNTKIMSFYEWECRECLK